MPSQDGKTVIVTGANTGIGFVMAKALATKGASVVMACRSVERGKRAMQSIKTDAPDADVEVMQMDLNSLDSVRDFSEKFKKERSKLDLLINNAGVMFLRDQTKEGFDAQFGINHLGHFALTMLLVESLAETSEPGVVNVTSSAESSGRRVDFRTFDPKDLSLNRFSGYSISKFANLVFTVELQRRCIAADKNIRSTAASPGFTRTELGRNSSRMFSLMSLGGLFTHSAEHGALPPLIVATREDVKPGDYYAPSSFFNLRGSPTKMKVNEKALSRETGAALWELSKNATGLDLPDSWYNGKNKTSA